jgi:hypothetical protein
MAKKLLILNAPGNITGSLFREEALDTIINNKYEKLENDTYTDDAPKKRGRKKKSKMYFTQDTEDAIVLYNNETDSITKEKIYEDKIKYSIEKLAENCINTWSFSYIDENYKDLKAEVVSHIMLNMHKYDQTKGRAFSYFSIVAKNYLIIANNESYALKKVTHSIDSDQEDDQFDFDIVDETHENDVKNEDLSEFIRLMVDYWDENIQIIFKKKRDIEIAYSINELFRNVKSLDYFNKKSLYCLIREMNGHKTQNITRVINKMMNHYKIIKNMYFTSGKIEGNAFFYKKLK